MNEEQDIFEPGDGLAELDAHLRLVLGVEPPLLPEGLAEDVFNATAEQLPLDPHLAELNVRLGEALGADKMTPGGLADRVFAATVGDVMGTDEEFAELEGALAGAMSVQAPAGLADRLFAATVNELGVAEEEEMLSPVIGRIGFGAAVWRGAMAAMLLFGLSAGLWLASHPVTPEPTLATIDAADAIEFMMEDFERALADADVIDSQLSELHNDIEQTFSALDEDIFSDSLADTAGMAYDDFYTDDLYQMNSGGGLSF